MFNTITIDTISDIYNNDTFIPISVLQLENEVNIKKDFKYLFNSVDFALVRQRK